jgi:hypothetical protein
MGKRVRDKVIEALQRLEDIESECGCNYYSCYHNSNIRKNKQLNSQPDRLKIKELGEKMIKLDLEAEQ